jgi:hypothetical protein
VNNQFSEKLDSHPKLTTKPSLYEDRKRALLLILDALILWKVGWSEHARRLAEFLPGIARNPSEDRK